MYVTTCLLPLRCYHLLTLTPAAAGGGRLLSFHGAPGSDDWAKVDKDVCTALNVESSPSLSASLSGGTGLACIEARRSMLLATNTDVINDALLRVLDRSSRMLQAGAYLHWYTRYGTELHEFHEAFEVLSGVVKAYSE